MRGKLCPFLRDAPVRLVFTHPVHDVQFTAKSLDGAADLQQLEPQSIVYGQAGSHPVGEVWQKPGRRGEKGWNEGVGGGKNTQDKRAHVQSICHQHNGPTALVGSESSFRFSSHSWSCFFTLFMRDSCSTKHKRFLPETFTQTGTLCTTWTAVLTES